MERGKSSSTGRGGKSKAPQHPQDIFALGSKSTVVVSRDSEKRNIHKPSTSGVERKREPSGFSSQPPSKRSRIGSPAESVGGTSLEVDPVDLVPNVLQALDTHNSDKLLGLLTGSIRLLKSQRSKPDPILCMSMLYLTKIRPNMFAHDTVTQSLCTLLKREQGAAFKNKGNPLVFVLACNMLYAGHRDSNNWPDTFIKVYIEDALNERWWVECSWCKCLVENIVTAFNTKQPPPHLIPSDNTLGTMSPSGSGSPLMGSTDEDIDNTELEYSVFPRYSSSYETVEAMVLEAIKEQIQRRAAPDAIGKGFLKLLSATCGFPEIRMISASRLEAWLHSGKLWRAALQLLACVCSNADACGPTAARDHEVLAQLARMRLKTKPLQAAYHACLREMVSESPALLRSVVTHTIYNELSNVRSPNNMAVLAALVQAQPQLVPAAMADTYQELLLRPEDYLRPLRALTRECVRAARADAAALLPLARALAVPPPHDPPAEIRERAFSSLADLFCLCCLLTASHSKHLVEYRQQLCAVQASALGWLLDTAMPLYKPSRHDYQHALNKIMFVEPAETYSKTDNWPPESERAQVYRLCCEAPLPQHTLLRVIFIGLSKEIPVAPADVFELVEQVVRRACALPAEESPLQVDKLEIAEYLFQLCQFSPPDNIALPAGYSPPPLAITSLYWRAWMLLAMLAAHNPHGFAERAASTYPTLRALIEMCITGKPSIEWSSNSSAETERLEAERVAVLQLETHLASASNAKLPITEHTSRLLSQLTSMEPLGPARKPPPSVLESLQSAAAQLRLGKLLCRQSALLLELVERHGTRRAMPWLHQLLRHDRLELSVLPVQCLCEFLSAGWQEAGKAGELCAHLRRTVADSQEGARAVLHYYLQRLAHPTAATRAQASRGLKLVLTQNTDETTEMDYNADVSPEEWLELVWELRHWETVREEVVARVRAACLVECVPRHVAAYLAFLARYVAAAPALDHTDLVLDLSQLVMERTTVMSSVLPPAELRDPPPRTEPYLAQHRALHAITSVLYHHLQKVRCEETSVPWAGGERVSLQWAGGRRAELHVLVAHAHLKLLCYGPSIYDSDQEMYSWLQSVWVGSEAAVEGHGAGAEAGAGEEGEAAGGGGGGEESLLLPDWLRLHLVRSARPALLDAALRGLPAHKLALFIQTFGMPVAAMSALLSALDACPAGAVVRLGVERGYMAQLLRVQRARGATGGSAFAAALRLRRTTLPSDEEIFTETPLEQEEEDAWDDPPEALPLQVSQVGTLLNATFLGGQYRGDLDLHHAQLHALMTEEMKCAAGGGVGGGGHTSAVRQWVVRAAVEPGAGAAAGLLRRVAYGAPLLRALLPATTPALTQAAAALLQQYQGVSGPVVGVLRALVRAGGAPLTPQAPLSPCAPLAPFKQEPGLPQVPLHATREQLIAVLESCSASTLEAAGQRIIDTHDTQLAVDVISALLENTQDGLYDTPVKREDGGDEVHVLSQSGRGCGLLLDWLSELQRETLGPQPQRQMRLMFKSGCARWRPLLVTLLAHRASWRTLHTCLDALLQPTGGWAASLVLEFAETMIGSPRVWQGRDKATPKHYTPEDTLRLTHHQVGVLVRYVVEEGEEAAAAAAGEEAAAARRRRIEARLPLVLRCCGSEHALLAAALAAATHHPDLLLLLYMKVPKISRLLAECEELGAAGVGVGCARGAGCVAGVAGGGGAWLGATAATSATDRVSHTLLTALAAPHHHNHHHKCNDGKLRFHQFPKDENRTRMESEVRAVWARARDAGRRALPLAGALLRGAPLAPSARRDHHLLAAIEMLTDGDLFHGDEIHGILECFLNICAQQSGGGGGGGGSGGGGGGGGGVVHRVAALLRRYLACRPQPAALLLHHHAATIANIPALSSLTSADVSMPASQSPPPHALLALQRRTATDDDLLAHLQEVETWGSRRGGAWGGAHSAATLARAVGPLLSSAHGPLRSAALSLLAKLLPAVPAAGHTLSLCLQVILEGLESPQPEVALSVLDKLPELVVGLQEHAAPLLLRVFELGLRSRHPVDQCIAKCVATINLHRGC